MIDDYERCPCCKRFMSADRSKLQDEDFIIYTCSKCGRIKQTYHDVSEEEEAWGFGGSIEFLDTPTQRMRRDEQKRCHEETRDGQRRISIDWFYLP